jgi:transcription-repair coupling factor (superfamily II helicase)
MSFYQRLANLERPEQVEAMVAELTDRFGTPPEPVSNLLGIVRLKTEAAALGYESVALREGDVVLKLRRTVSVDRVGMYKRYRNDARIQPGEVKIPRRRFADNAAEWLTQLSEVLPVVVGHTPQPPVATNPEPALQTGR